MKKLLLITLALISSSAFGYKINIKNDTDYVLIVTPKFAAGIKKYQWIIQPHANFFNETHAYCTQSLKFEATEDASKQVEGQMKTAVLPVGIEYKPKSTGAGMRCADFKAVVTALEGKLQVANPDEKVVAVKK